jgi:integrase
MSQGSANKATSNNWITKVKRGFYMRGGIYSDQRGGCSCGGKFVQREQFGHKVPVCNTCGNYPTLLRIKRYLPSIREGKGKEITIRYTKANKRITDIIDALSVMKRIDEELLYEEFNPMDYVSGIDREFFKFKNLSESYVKLQRDRVQRNEITPYTFEGKERYHRLYLVPYFKESFVDQIGKRDILHFYNSFVDKLRTRDLRVQELRVFLNYLHEHEYLKVVPKFPRTAASRKLDGENFIDLETQALIINSIENPLYRAMIKTLALYMLRPCEVRALRVRDIDFVKNTLSVSHHFSRNKLLKGRKSDGRKLNPTVHRLPLTPIFLEQLREVGFSDNWGSERYIFSLNGKGPIGMKTLSTYWRRAADKCGYQGVTLYQGTRHAGLSNLINKGVNEGIAMKISGHSSSEAFRRYGQVRTANLEDYLI